MEHPVGTQHIFIDFYAYLRDNLSEALFVEERLPMKKFLRSFMYALNGIRAAMREQRNVKVQSIIALITVGAGFYFNITPIEWCLTVFAIAMVIGFEIMNSAIEGLVDLVKPEKNPLAGKIKDMAAGAVLFASITAVIIGLLIFRKYLML